MGGADQDRGPRRSCILPASGPRLTASTRRSGSLGCSTTRASRTRTSLSSPPPCWRRSTMCTRSVRATAERSGPTWTRSPHCQDAPCRGGASGASRTSGPPSVRPARDRGAVQAAHRGGPEAASRRNVPAGRGTVPGKQPRRPVTRNRFVLLPSCSQRPEVTPAYLPSGSRAVPIMIPSAAYTANEVDGPGLRGAVCAGQA